MKLKGIYKIPFARQVCVANLERAGIKDSCESQNFATQNLLSAGNKVSSANRFFSKKKICSCFRMLCIPRILRTHQGEQYAGNIISCSHQFSFGKLLNMRNSSCEFRNIPNCSHCSQFVNAVVAQWWSTRLLTSFQVFAFLTKNQNRMRQLPGGRRFEPGRRRTLRHQFSSWLIG